MREFKIRLSFKDPSGRMKHTGADFMTWTSVKEFPGGVEFKVPGGTLSLSSNAIRSDIELKSIVCVENPDRSLEFEGGLSEWLAEVNTYGKRSGNALVPMKSAGKGPSVNSWKFKFSCSCSRGQGEERATRDFTRIFPVSQVVEIGGVKYLPRWIVQKKVNTEKFDDWWALGAIWPAFSEVEKATREALQKLNEARHQDSLKRVQMGLERDKKLSLRLDAIEDMPDDLERKSALKKFAVERGLSPYAMGRIKYLLSLIPGNESSSRWNVIPYNESLTRNKVVAALDGLPDSIEANPG